MGAVLVLGGDGLLGGAVAERFRATAKIWRTTLFPETAGAGWLLLDLAQDVSTWRPPTRVDVAFLCAAVTSTAQCRASPETTALVNVQHTLALARGLAADGTFVVFPSSSQVFDGSQPFRKTSDPVSPQTVYGRQKVAVEQQLLPLGGQAAVVRFTKVWGRRVGLIDNWVAELRAGKTIHPLEDLPVAPVPASLAAEALYQVGTRRLPGLSQVSGARDVTYAQVAELLAARLGAGRGLVQPVPAASAGLALELRPQYTTLDMSRLEATCGLKPPEIGEVLDVLNW
ncbi:MAG: sugar nucleotide-binding protein [Planctomycetota bacterium]